MAEGQNRQMTPPAPPPLPGQVRLFSRDEHGQVVAWNSTIMTAEEKIALVVDILGSMVQGA